MKLLKVLSKIFSLSFQAILISIISYLLIFQLLKPVQGFWGIYHYYINAKYFKELGYFNLYTCTLRTNSTNLQEIVKARDLFSYKIIPTNEMSNCPIKNFRNNRWNEFSHDIKILTNHTPPSFWSLVLTDKGFNPTPFWTAIAKFLSSFVSLENRENYLIFFNLDLVFIIIAGVLVGINLGRLAGLLTLTLSFIYFGSFLVLSNNYLQYVWYPLMVASVIFWKIKKPLLSGALIGFAAGMQAFPGIFAIPVVIVTLKYYLKKQKKDLKISLQFLFSFATTIFISVLVGIIYFGNLNVWSEWNKKISIHKNYINSEIFNIGFTNLFSTLVTADKSDSYSYATDTTHTFNRSESLKVNSTLLTVISIFLLISVSYILWKSKTPNPLSYGYFYIYILLTLSPYYYLIFSLLPLMFWNFSKSIRVWSTGSISFLLVIHLILFKGSSISFMYNIHLISGLIIFIFFAALFLVLILNKHINYKESFKKLKQIFV